MVRSSGIEDGQLVANAGGNASIAYVNPEQDTIQAAMAEVVASYFDIHSLRNCINGGEQISINTLCIPVLIQQLVGEALGGSQNDAHIPISGVAFTTNKSISDSQFSITEINAAYGHGEGIVANRVHTDRYYVVPSRISEKGTELYFAIAAKEQRLVATYDQTNNKHSLTIMPNASTLRYKSALSEKQITQLYAVLKNIESVYGQPMDVEFVVMGDTIYIVQARPVISRELQPSYTLPSLHAHATSIHQATMLVPAKGNCIVVTDPNDIIVTQTLDEADVKPNSRQAKAVIVGKWASPLSHAAVNFMGYGIPCFYVTDVQLFKKMVEKISPDKPLVIDTQKKTFLLLSQMPPSLSEHTAHGWYEHPAARVISLPMNHTKMLRAVANPLPQDGVLVQLLENLKHETEARKQKEIVEKITHRITAHMLFTAYHMQAMNTVCTDEFKEAFNVCKSSIENSITNMQRCIDDGAERLEFLFYHKMLEALVYQPAESGYLVGTYNYAYFLNELLSKKSMHVSIKKSGNPFFASEYTYKDYAISSDIMRGWVPFLELLAQDAQLIDASNNYAQKSVQTFRKMLDSFARLEALPIWFATDFYACMDAIKNCSDAQKRKDIACDFFVQCVAGYTADVSENLKKLQNTKNVFSTVRNAVSLCSSQEHVNDLWQKIKRDIIEPFSK